MDQAIAALSLHLGQHLGEDAVHVPRAQGAPDRDHQGQMGIQPQLRLGAVLGIAGKLPPHRRPRDGDLLRIGVMLPALLKAHQNGVHLIGQHPGGEAGEGVGLMHQRGNVQLHRRRQHRVAHIAAGADHRVGLKVLQYLFGRVLRGQHVLHGLHIVQHPGEGALPADVGDFEPADLVARPGHQIHLHLSLRAEEQKLALGHQLPQPSGHRQSGIHMSGGTAAGQNKSHLFLLCIIGLVENDSRSHA